MVALNKTYLKTLTPDRSAKDSGRRFYSAEISRWLSRDPIEERGGQNLYSFALNNALKYHDYLGREPAVEPRLSYAAGLLVGPHGFAGQGRSRFWDQTSEAYRNAWFNEFRRRYADDINRAARRYCVPRRLLAAVIANERLDHPAYEARLEHYFGQGESIGVAQITIHTALEYGIVPQHEIEAHISGLSFLDTVDSTRDELEYLVVRRLLSDPSRNIDLAGRLLRQFIAETCESARLGSRSAHGALGQTFQELTLWSLAGPGTSGPPNQGYRSQYADLCCNECPVDLVPSSGLLQAFGAIWNSQPGVWTYTEQQFQDQRNHPGAFNAWRNAGAANHLLDFAREWE